MKAFILYQFYRGDLVDAFKGGGLGVFIWGQTWREGILFLNINIYCGDFILGIYLFLLLNLELYF
jgi:hypothetical protein